MIVIFRKHFIIKILLSSITLITANKVHSPPKSVNVALETSFLFDPKELQENRYFVTNIQEFLDKLLMVIHPQKPRSRFRTQSKRRDTKQKLEERTDETKTETGSIKNVLDFVKNVGQTFVNLTGNKIAEAVSNMHVEVITEPTKLKYKGPTAISKTAKPDKRDKRGKKDIKASINNWMRRYLEEMRTIMDSTVDGTNPFLSTFARRMDNDDAIKRIMKLLKKGENHIENNQAASEIVNELINNEVFEPFFCLVRAQFALYMWYVGNVPFKHWYKDLDQISLFNGGLIGLVTKPVAQPQNIKKKKKL